MKKMNLIVVSAEQVKQSERRNYNPQAWERNVDSLSKYEDLSFYATEDGEKFYAIYKLDEGFSVLNEITYGACMSGTGFLQVGVNICTEDFVLISDLFIEGKFNEDVKVSKNKRVLSFTGFGADLKGRADNCKANRQQFAKMKIIVTNI